MTFHRRISLNHGHDWATIETKPGSDEQNAAVEITFEGRDPSKIIITLSNINDVNAIGYALLEAAKNIA